MNRYLSILALLSLCALKHTSGFTSQVQKSPTTELKPPYHRPTQLYNQKPEYSREVILREEAESPFRKVRFFFYYSLAGGALTSLLVSLARIAAGLNGINTDLLDESLTNAGIDLAGIIVLAFAFKRDLEAQESRYKRATKGAELAKLAVRGSKSMLGGEADSSETFQTTLASLRRGRGIEKRVVIAAAGAEKIKEVIEEAKKMNDDLFLNDLLIVPVVMPDAVAPVVEDIPECIALPTGSNWKIVMDDEKAEADKQGIDVMKDGICVILKKNGRVGQRTKGVYLSNMVGDVQSRASRGMDISNI